MREEIANQKSEEELLTLPAVALALGIARSTAFELARRGVLPCTRAGRWFVISRRDLERFRAEHPPQLVVKKYA